MKRRIEKRHKSTQRGCTTNKQYILNEKNVEILLGIMQILAALIGLVKVFFS